MSTFDNERKRSCRTLSAFNSSEYSNTVTCLTIPAKSIAASTPELPPPITATSLFSNRGPSQCGQKATPLLIKRSSPGMLSLRQLAPVEMMAVLVSNTASFSKITRIALSVFLMFFARIPVIVSISY
ncbi:Uncharacterised protein [Streptococcus pneumoniae]|nr:Uncharacterised protein [Streptococcus pneumoniae]